jgi:2-oxoglutarate ferredoxin oxidoreductase subunit delta
MAGKIIIDRERCKGCGLCVSVCPKNCVAISPKPNKMGYFPSQVVNSLCTGCTRCALVCPDVAIEVYREQIQGHKHPKKSTPVVVEEKS